MALRLHNPHGRAADPARGGRRQKQWQAPVARREGTYMKQQRQMPGELIGLRRFRAWVLYAFAAGEISCNCMGVTHDKNCPLGLLEVEAEAMPKADNDEADRRR